MGWRECDHQSRDEDEVVDAEHELERSQREKRDPDLRIGEESNDGIHGCGILTCFGRMGLPRTRCTLSRLATAVIFMRKLIAHLFTSTLIFAGFVQPAAARLQSGEVQVWQVQEITLAAARQYANPYVDVECWVE